MKTRESIYDIKVYMITINSYYLINHELKINN